MEPHGNPSIIICYCGPFSVQAVTINYVDPWPTVEHTIINADLTLTGQAWRFV